MRLSPRLPRNPLLEEWARAKTLPEWDRYYRREVPLRDRLAVFMDYIPYFAAADLCYIDHGLLEKPESSVLFSIEWIAEGHAEDAEVWAALWFLRSDLCERESRWSTQNRLLVAMNRMGREAAHG